MGDSILLASRSTLLTISLRNNDWIGFSLNSNQNPKFSRFSTPFFRPFQMPLHKCVWSCVFSVSRKLRGRMRRFGVNWKRREVVTIGARRNCHLQQASLPEDFHPLSVR
ncbi:hypothetical protein PFISCL1PPCAC_25556 [Pristionchus fissidentatus]|uniref:Ribosomal protein n=1 Tax=Pristionchus fissidentatus TaxID=1538716 RepID=A0AAV5WU99_9BILA|nr:hypothetical protein PFISCL1PPCAC_25556 [Pristionchus fissidentatus]